MTVFRNVRNSAGYFYRCLRLRRDLSGLADTSPQISAAIFDAANRNTSKAEDDWIRHIEDLRYRMKASSEELQFMDYGSGSGNATFTEQEMYRGRVAVRNFSSLGLDNVEVVRGRFQDTLSEVLLANPCVDYAFIDGHHDEKATLNYFNAFVPALAATAVVVFDDIDWSEGRKRAWHTIQHHPSARVAVDLGSMGLIATTGVRPQFFSTRF